jgi:hypothetical protein
VRRFSKKEGRLSLARCDAWAKFEDAGLPKFIGDCNNVAEWVISVNVLYKYASC